MIYIKDGVFEKLKEWKKDSIYILTDFDRTLTKGSSKSSWQILSKDNFIDEYEIERKALYDYYRPFEINEKIDETEKSKLMEEWWSKHISLLIKYKMGEKLINDALEKDDIMSFRDGAKEYLKTMYEYKIPIIIISAGIGNFIEKFLIKNNCYYDNIHIISNFIEFKDGVAVGIKGNFIHSLNKHEITLNKNVQQAIKDRENIILLGDILSDIKMANDKIKSIIKIGFLDENIEENLKYYRDEFDIVCTHNTGYDDLYNFILNYKQKND